MYAHYVMKNFGTHQDIPDTKTQNIQGMCSQKGTGMNKLTYSDICKLVYCIIFHMS